MSARVFGFGRHYAWRESLQRAPVDKVCPWGVHLSQHMKLFPGGILRCRDNLWGIVIHGDVHSMEAGTTWYSTELSTGVEKCPVGKLSTA